MMRGAFATTFVGNMIPLIAPVRTPCISASSRIVRFSPSRPPTPISVKPKPSWNPVPNSAVMITSSEKPFEPSGILVVMSPIALSERKSATVSSSAPAYSPCSGSKNR